MISLRTHRISLGRGLALLLTAMALSGCISLAVESDFNDDGSASHSYAITIDMSELGDLGEGADTEAGFEAIEEEAAEEGYRVENISEGDVLGVRVSRDVEDTEDLGQILNELFNTGTEEGQEANPFSGTFERDGDDYRLELTVDGDTLSQGAGEGMGDAGGGDIEDLGIGMEQILELSYTARLPGEIDEDETNGTLNADGSVTWTLPVSGQETLIAESSTGGDDSNLLLILVAVGAIFLGLIALAVVGFIFFIGRRTPAPGEPSTSAPHSPPPATEQAWFTSPDQPTRPLPGPADDDSRPSEPVS